MRACDRNKKAKAGWHGLCVNRQLEIQIRTMSNSVWGKRQAERSGFLDKLFISKAGGKRWLTRFFSLEGKYLKYYTDEKRSALKGAVDMNRLQECKFAVTDSHVLLLELLVSGEVVRAVRVLVCSELH